MPGKRLKNGFRGVVMKEIFLVAALFICCSAARAQRPNPPTSAVVVSIVGGYGGMGFNFGCTAY
jgi:hypothetical protein